MAGTNDFQLFATDPAANVLTTAAYIADAQRTIGNQPGVARSNFANKTMRQSATMAAVLAQFIVDRTGQNAVDDGTIATLLANLKSTVLDKLNGDTMSGPLAMSASAINEAQGANIASASAVNLGGATGNYVHVTGTVTITAITLSQGAERTVVFDDALTLTNGASLILPGGANITTAVGDVAIFRGEAAGVVRCILYMPANGYPLLSGFESSKASNGYQKLPSGLIIQWGFAALSNSGTPVTFPIAFPSAGVSAVATSAQTGTVFADAAAVTTTGFTGYSSSGTNGAYWIAIGY